MMVALLEKSTQSVAEELEHIEGMDRIDLILCWRRMFKCNPAKNLSSPMMRRIIGHEIQCRLLGGLSLSVQRALKQSSKPSYTLRGDRQSRSVPLLKPGTQLIREWNGRSYRVEVVEQGFVMDGKTYRSLSAIAKRITGCHWSGPRFFGLKTAR